MKTAISFIIFTLVYLQASCSERPGNNPELSQEKPEIYLLNKDAKTYLIAFKGQLSSDEIHKNAKELLSLGLPFSSFGHDVVPKTTLKEYVGSRLKLADSSLGDNALVIAEKILLMCEQKNKCSFISFSNETNKALALVIPKADKDAKLKIDNYSLDNESFTINFDLLKPLDSSFFIKN